MSKRKIALVGAGQIGGTMALALAQKNLGDVVLVDVVEGMPQGKALDIMEGRLSIHTSSIIVGSNDFHDLHKADVVIVTAGVPRKPGMTRDDLLNINFGIIEKVGLAIKDNAPDAFVIVITNPLDAMVYAMQKVSGLPPAKVVGMAGVLDSSRLSSFVATELGVDAEDVQALVMGGHGPSMVSLYEFVSVGGIPLPQLMDRATFDKISQHTAMAGDEIVGLLKTGSAFYSPGLSAVKMAEAYLLDKKSVMPCAAYLDGQFGVQGMYCGVPVLIGEGGVERIFEVSLTPEEKAAFDKSVEAVKGNAEWVDAKMKA